jgi:hypothetical protein
MNSNRIDGHARKSFSNADVTIGQQLLDGHRDPSIPLG